MLRTRLITVTLWPRETSHTCICHFYSLEKGNCLSFSVRPSVCPPLIYTTFRNITLRGVTSAGKYPKPDRPSNRTTPVGKYPGSRGYHLSRNASISYFDWRNDADAPLTDRSADARWHHDDRRKRLVISPSPPPPLRCNLVSQSSFRYNYLCSSIHCIYINACVKSATVYVQYLWLKFGKNARIANLGVVVTSQ